MVVVVAVLAGGFCYPFFYFVVGLAVARGGCGYGCGCGSAWIESGGVASEKDTVEVMVESFFFFLLWFVVVGGGG